MSNHLRKLVLIILIFYIRKKLGAYFKLFFNILSHLQSVNQNQLLCRKKIDSVNNLFKHQDTSFYFSLNSKVMDKTLLVTKTVFLLWFSNQRQRKKLCL